MQWLEIEVIQGEGINKNIFLHDFFFFLEVIQHEKNVGTP